jgi:hypothetical protein
LSLLLIAADQEAEFPAAAKPILRDRAATVISWLRNRENPGRSPHVVTTGFDLGSRRMAGQSGAMTVRWSSAMTAIARLIRLSA